MSDYRDQTPSRSDIYRHEDHGKGMYSGGWSGRRDGYREFGFTFEDGHSGYYYLSWLDIVYDSRIKVRDLVDFQPENGIRIRGEVVEIDAVSDQPYRIQHRGSSVWMAAHEFERFIRADAPEKAYASLMQVQARIELLETELTALRITEEVLQGVYI